MGVWRHFHEGSNFRILTLFGSGYAGLGKADPLEKNLGAKQQEIVRVHSEDMNRHTAYRRQPEKPDAVESKVISPNVSPGMKQTDEFARRWIKPGDIRAFKPIAVEAGHRKVIEYGGAGVLPGDNMIDLEGEPIVRIRDPAVLAAMGRSLPYLLNQNLVH